MWKLKNHVKNIRQFSIKNNKIGVLTKNGEIQYHHIETVKNAPLLTIQAEEYGKLNLIQNFLIWNNHYGKMSIFSVLNGNKINIEGSGSSKIHFFNENKGGFYALKKINKQNIITVKYEEKENSFKEVWNINKSPYLFFANPEDGYSIISNYGRELTKINSHDGSIIWRTEFDSNIFENFTWIFGVCDNKILLYTNNHKIISINTTSGKIDWVIDEIPKPKEWPDGVNLGFTNIQLLGRESKLIGLRERRLWIIDIKEGVVSKMVDLSNTLNDEVIFSQSPFAFDVVDSLIFFDQYERKLVSLNWKTEKVESTTHFPVRGKESFSQWQGPIVEGDNCFLLDRLGTLYIFERT